MCIFRSVFVLFGQSLVCLDAGLKGVGRRGDHDGIHDEDGYPKGVAAPPGQLCSWQILPAAQSPWRRPGVALIPSWHAALWSMGARCLRDNFAQTEVMSESCLTNNL